MKSYLRNALIILVCIFCFVGCDQSTKQFAKNMLENSSLVSYAGGLVKFVYVENPGAMLSFGAELSKPIKFYVMIVGVSFLLTLLLIFMIIKRQDSLVKEIALILILSGGLGNLLDRITNDGKVIDFIILGIAGIHTAVFNLADTFIMFGTLLFIFSGTKKHDKENMSIS